MLCISIGLLCLSFFQELGILVLIASPIGLKIPIIEMKEKVDKIDAIISREFNSFYAVVYYQFRKQNKMLSSVVRDYLPNASPEMAFELILVDDGSCDGSLKEMQNFKKIVIIKLAANYGQSNAIAAGLANAKGNYVVVMDADLQDKPEDILELYQEIKHSDKIMVIAVSNDHNNSLWKNVCSRAFNYLSYVLTTLNHPAGSGVFRIMRRECLQLLNDALNTPGTVLSYFQARCSWKTIQLKRDIKKTKGSSYTFAKIFRLAMSRFLPYSKIPLLRKLCRFTGSYVPHYKVAEVYWEKHEK
jgi:glycosyltransferase involved in cell wall biosynthesis